MYDCMHHFIIMNGVYIMCVDYVSQVCCSCIVSPIVVYVCWLYIVIVGDITHTAH